MPIVYPILVLLHPTHQNNEIQKILAVSAALQCFVDGHCTLGPILSEVAARLDFYI